MRRHDHRAIDRRPELSQHFLRDDAARAVVRRLPYPGDSTVIEPGAGDGVLTQALADAGCHVVAIETDARLYRRLGDRFAHHPRVTCIHADFLAFPLPATPYRIVSNVPYTITAALVRKLLHAARPPDDALLIVQREAAQKFAGVPRETLFSLLHKPWFDIEIATALSRHDFIPPPRVASALLRITHRAWPLISAASAPRYSAFVRKAFAGGAPDAARTLRPHLTPRQYRRLAANLNFARDCRTSQLTFEQWLGVFRFVEHECLGHDPTIITTAA